MFIAELLGLPVFEDGHQIGIIKDVLSMPGNDVYIVKGEKEYMIPAVREFIKEINMEDGYVNVVLIEGMQTDAD